MTAVPPTVPFVRVIKQDDVGNDVVAVKRALSRAGFMQWGEFTRVAGPFFIRAVNAFKKAKGLKQNSKYDFPGHEALRKTHRKGSRSEWAYDRFAIAIMNAEDISPHDRVAQKTIDAVDYAISHRDQMAYMQVRPMPDNAPFPNLPNPCDCSQFAGKWAPKSGGWYQDPNYPLGSARKFDNYGWTGTLWEQGTYIGVDLSRAEVCDLVFYGTPWQSGGSAHVTIVRKTEPGTVPLVGSMGSSRGPLNVYANYRRVTGIRRYRLV